MEWLAVLATDDERARKFVVGFAVAVTTAAAAVYVAWKRATRLKKWCTRNGLTQTSTGFQGVCGGHAAHITQAVTEQVGQFNRRLFNVHVTVVSEVLEPLPHDFVLCGKRSILPPGLLQVTTGDTSFDSTFNVGTTQPNHVRQLLSDAGLRRALLKLARAKTDIRVEGQRVQVRVGEQQKTLTDPMPLLDRALGVAIGTAQVLTFAAKGEPVFESQA